MIVQVRSDFLDIDRSDLIEFLLRRNRSAIQVGVGGSARLHAACCGLSTGRGRRSQNGCKQSNLQAEAERRGVACRLRGSDFI